MGPEGGIVMKENSKKGKGDTIVLARRRRSSPIMFMPIQSYEDQQ
jgi:hypothetical protein